MAHHMESFKDRYVVVDTDSNFIYIGKLKIIDRDYIVLNDVDVHDSRESPSVKEKYLIDSKRYGVRVNRRKVYIRMEKVISLSALDDIIEY